jgi:exonuclease III
MDLRAQIDPNMMIVGDLNTPLTPIDISFRQNNQHRNFRNIIMGIIDIYKAFQSTTMQYTFFTAAHGTFFKIVF